MAAASSLPVGAANAAIYVSATSGPQAAVPAGGILVNFDDPLPWGVTLSGSYSIASGSVHNVNAEPWLDKTKYLFAPTAGDSSGNATIMFADALGYNGLDSLTFYWGSVDQYNTLTFLDRLGAPIASITGAVFPPANGTQTGGATNINFTATFTNESRGLIGGVNFGSARPAYELDDFHLATGSVPEPTTWAMMIIGFGGAGAMLRRQRRRNLLQVA
ncbi:MAG: PEPxxWA-CTERM sorting domain-containing protein [Patescibacteria group bacterium]